MSRALRAGIIGLPNAGKSTLFNVLTGSAVPAEGYPFTTIEPNVGIVEVPDARLERLFQRVSPPKAVPATVEFVDIAGLVAGAHRGEGLGNRFLAHIREVEAIVHVLRCFDDSDVAHPEGTIDPTRDIGVVETELMLADLEAVEKRLERVERVARSGDREAQHEVDLLDRLRSALGEGAPARDLECGEAERVILDELFLLTRKPVLYLANVAEANAAADPLLVQKIRSLVSPSPVLALSCRLEEELLGLSDEERIEYMEALGVEELGVHRLIRATYELLGLITFFTFNEKEVRAWTVRRGAHAPEAAGAVHTDFERGFIRAETVSFEDLDQAGSLKSVRDQGLMRSGGRDYEVRDGDIMLFRASA